MYFRLIYILMIILEVTSYWGMQWGKKSISLRNIRHQRYLVLDIGAVYGILTLGFTHHCTKGREGVDGAPLGFLFYCNILIFDILSSLQHEVYFMGGGAAGGLWHHQTWLPSWPPSWIFSRIRNQVKTVRIKNFCA